MTHVPQVACSSVACLEATHAWQEDGLHAEAQLSEYRAADLLRRRYPGLSLRRQRLETRSSQNLCAIGPPGTRASRQQIASALQRVSNTCALCRIPGRQSVPDDGAQQALLQERARSVRDLLWHMIPSRGYLASRLPAISGSHRVATGPSQRRVGDDPGGEQPRSQTHCDSSLPDSLLHRGYTARQYEHRTDPVSVPQAELTKDVLLALPWSIVPDFQGDYFTQSGWGPGLPHMLAASRQRQCIVHQVQIDKQELIQISGFLLHLCGFAC